MGLKVSKHNTVLPAVSMILYVEEEEKGGGGIAMAIVHSALFTR